MDAAWRERTAGLACPYLGLVFPPGLFLLMTQVSEQQLVADAQRGDAAALSDLLEMHQNRLFNIARRMVGNRDDAAEITQDAMCRIIEHIGTYDGRSAVGTWMVRIVMNLAISHGRKQQKRQAISMDAEFGGGGSGDTWVDQVGALRKRMADYREPDPEFRVEQSELIERLHEALDLLDEDFKAVIVLRDFDGLDYQQIGQALDIPVGTVKSRLFRARLALREQMLNLCPTQRPESPVAGRKTAEAE